MMLWQSGGAAKMLLCHGKSLSYATHVKSLSRYKIFLSWWPLNSAKRPFAIAKLADVGRHLQNRCTSRFFRKRVYSERRKPLKNKDFRRFSMSVCRLNLQEETKRYKIISQKIANLLCLSVLLQTGQTSSFARFLSFLSRISSEPLA